MTWIKFVDITHQAVWVPQENLHAIVIPSQVSTGGDGQCRIVAAGGIVSMVARAEAERLLRVVTGAADINAKAGVLNPVS